MHTSYTLQDQGPCGDDDSPGYILGDRQTLRMIWVCYEIWFIDMWMIETYIMRPCNAMLLGICLNVTLKVNVVAFLDVIGTQCGAQ